MSTKIKIYQPNFSVPINTTNKSCWHEDSPWDNEKIDAIKDYAGVQATDKINSLPSPLGRMLFFDEAFRFVNLHPEIRTLYHQAVSDCLDVWEIFFYYDAYQHQGLDFFAWDFANIVRLQHHTNPNFQLLGKALSLYLPQNNSLQVQAINKLYLITHDNRVFAGSSPYTGFFTTPNPIQFRLPIQNSNQYFFEQVRLLDQRNVEFQEYMHKFAKTQEISRYFKHFYNYIYRLGERNNEMTALVWGNPKVNFEEDYPQAVNNREREDLPLVLLDQATINGNAGITLKKHHPKVTQDCEFFLRSAQLNLQVEADEELKPPLVLKTAPEGRKKVYVGKSHWNPEIKVPAYNTEALDERMLPGQGITYPYLSTNDFLEDYLIRLPYEIDDAHFLTCNTIKDKDDVAYLLPLKPQYFEYFAADLTDLQKHLSIQKRVSIHATAIEVTLKIPIGRIQKDVATNQRQIVGDEYLVLSRVYEEQRSSPTPHELQQDEKNRGHIIEYAMGLIFFPFFQTGLPQYDNFYKVGCLTDKREDPASEVTLEFYSKNALIEPLRDETLPGLSQEARLQKHTADQGSTYYQIHNTTFEMLRVNIQIADGLKATGVVLPRWKQIKVGETQYSFAIDLGTTNTHIAYQQGNKNPQPFDIGENDLQVIRLDKVTTTRANSTPTIKYDERNGKDLAVTTIVQRQRFEWMPSIIGDTYSFPTATALSQANPDNNHEPRLFGNANIAFFLNKRFDLVDLGRTQGETQIFTNLKWKVQEESNQNRLRTFVQQLLYLIRNKILLNRGNPEKARIYWFTPLSMPRHIQKHHMEIWESEYQKIIGGDMGNLIRLTESETPYYVFQKQGKVSKQTLNIDIGGGTTDLLVFKQGKASLATSCTFAGSVLFGNWNDLTNNRNNGLVRAFERYIEKRIDALLDQATSKKEQEAIAELKRINGQYLAPENNFNSADVLNFWLATSRFNFIKHFHTHPNFKLPFLLYLTGLCYHCTQIAQDKPDQFGLPTAICFSGNGSKMLAMISSKVSEIESLINQVFKEQLEVPNGYKIKVHTVREEQQQGPKQMTCNGALAMPKSEDASLVLKEDVTWQPDITLGENLTGINQDKAVTEITYQDLLNAQIKLGESEYEKFIELFFKLYKKLNFRGTFGITYKEDALRKILLAEVQDNYEKGVKLQLGVGGEEDNLQDNISETVFFYALKGAIYNLLTALADQKVGKNS